MSGVVEFAQAWLEWTAAASWQLALLVCLIGSLTYVLRDASPRLRYGLWLLVLLKAVLPPTLTAVWGVGTWGVAPVADLSWPGGAAEVSVDARSGDAPAAIDQASGDQALTASAVSGAASFALEAALLLAVWAAGCLALWLAVAWRYRRLIRRIDSLRRLDEGPARVELERVAERFSVGATPELYAIEQATSPMLVGVLRPRIVLPEALLERLNPEELRMILAHELVHWRRRDTWVGWLQVFVQGVFWFHPLVWLANARIRHERECACDETVLREARCDRDGYGETILRALAAARGRSLVMANMVGVFERGSRLQIRLEEIMSFDPAKRRFGWLSRGALIVAALVLLPMAAPGEQADGGDDKSAAAKSSDKSSEPSAEDVDNIKPARPKTNWPTIVKSTPKTGATNVDPGLTEISVTFDRDMDVNGFSWTGGGKFYPPQPEGATPVWTDKRTCVLPVQLKRGAFYRVGINSSSFQNFRSELGAAAETAAIYFTTAGAERAVQRQVRVPKIVKMAPDNGAEDIDPELKVIRVAFDTPMDTSSYSWTGGGPTFPTIPEGQKPRWSRDGKTCTLPVQLGPAKRYELGLNSVSHKNFASKWGVPLAPVRYEFRTAGHPANVGTSDLGASEVDAGEAGRAPRIVKMTPENGAKDVDPALAVIRVTFDRPMAGGFSWTGGGDHFPTIPEGKKPRWSADGKTCTLPVKLKPDWSYRMGLNSPSFKNFASADGVPLEPVVYEFRTSPGKE